MNIQENISLKDYTTFKLGGAAEYFVEVTNVEELKEALQWAKENSKKIFILGGGSNVIVPDEGLQALVIRIKLEKLEFSGGNVKVEAGVPLAFLLNKCLENSLTGLEFATGIPGTVGGAIRGNAGTYGEAMSNVVQKITYLDENLEVKDILASRCSFTYRHSIFKENKNIILSAELKLESGDVAASRKLVEERLQYRQDTQPNEPSAGCIFKNLMWDDAVVENLKHVGLELAKYKENGKIPAAYLIEKAGLKGKTMGGAQISKKHANYVVNTGQATTEQVIMLISYIKQQIRDKYRIQLQEEVQLLM